MISKRDSKPLKIKFPVGESNGDVVDMIYEDEWNTVYGLKNYGGEFNKKLYGIDTDFDIILTFNSCPLTRRINKQTLFLVENMPTDVFANGDYSVKYVFPELNGEVVVGVDHIQDISIPRLYFNYNNEILSTQLNFDSESKKAYVSRKQVIPFSVGDYVWTRKPNDNSDTDYRLKLSKINLVGLSKNNKDFYELVFEEI